MSTYSCGVDDFACSLYSVVSEEPVTSGKNALFQGPQSRRRRMMPASILPRTLGIYPDHAEYQGSYLQTDASTSKTR